MPSVELKRGIGSGGSRHLVLDLREMAATTIAIADKMKKYPEMRLDFASWALQY